jgi:hypothetical protein
VTDAVLDGVDLPEAQWIGRGKESPIQQTVTRGGDGTVRVQEQTKNGGLPIDLSVYLPWGTVKALLAKRTAGRVMMLDYYGEQFNVMWRHGDGAVEAVTRSFLVPPQDDDEHAVTLRLQTVPT